jgi:YhcH/YjgK/YiaL family protein
MIIDKLKNAELYQELSENLKQAFDYLAANDFSTMESGRYDIDGDTVYAMVQRYDTKPREMGLWEAHRRYIDVQFVASGIETLGWTNVANLTETQPYTEDKDYLLFAGDGDFVTARAGDFLIFFPEDGHMPCLAYESSVPVLKIVVKVLAE